MVYGVIYVITNLLNGMKYVGQTTQPIKVRFRQHMKANSYIGRAIRHDGVENFTVEVIEDCATFEQLNEREKFWIAFFNCMAPNGYNLTDGGEGVPGCSHTPESCLNDSVSKKKPSPYLTLTAELVARKLTYNALAKKLGWHTSKLARKMRGERIFMLHEMLEIKKLLGVDMPVEELFQRTDGKSILPPCPYAYPKLYMELQIRNITLTKLSEILGLAQPNISAKMYGKVKFSVAEAEKTRSFLNVDITVEKLFRLADGSAPEFSKAPPPYAYCVLANEMKIRGVTQKQLGEHLGIHQSVVSAKMHGLPEFTPEQQEAIKKFLGVDMSVEELFRRQ